MTSLMTLLRVGTLTAALIGVQSAHGPVRACEDTGAASQAPLAQTDTVDEQRADSGKSYAQSQQNISADIELATGDGQQGSLLGEPYRLR